MIPENRVYMKIKVNPLEPSAISTTFYGPTKCVERYRQIYREKIDDWSIDDDIYRNFLRIFGRLRSFFIYIRYNYQLSQWINFLNYYLIELDLIAFPRKDSFGNAGMSELCSICYTFRCADQIPIVSCDNDKCALNYHLICLKEWFATLRDTKVFLNMTSGRCPSCKEVNNLNLYFVFGVFIVWHEIMNFFPVSETFNVL